MKKFTFALLIVALMAGAVMACPRTRTVVRPGTTTTVQTAPAPVSVITVPTPSPVVVTPVQPRLQLEAPVVPQAQVQVQVPSVIRTRPGILPLIFGERTIVIQR